MRRVSACLLQIFRNRMQRVSVPFEKLCRTWHPKDLCASTPAKGLGSRRSPKKIWMTLPRIVIDLERKALGKSIRLGDDHWEVAILGTFHLLEKQEKVPLPDRLKQPRTWTNVHRDFHQSLVMACKSVWVLHFHRILFDQAHRYRMLSLRHRRPGKWNSRG